VAAIAGAGPKVRIAERPIVAAMAKADRARNVVMMLLV
jgi:hypothetical protein